MVPYNVVTVEKIKNNEFIIRISTDLGIFEGRAKPHPKEPFISEVIGFTIAQNRALEQYFGVAAKSELKTANILNEVGLHQEKGPKKQYLLEKEKECRKKAKDYYAMRREVRKYLKRFF